MEGMEEDDSVDLGIGKSFPLRPDYPVPPIHSKIAIPRILYNHGRNWSLQSSGENVVPILTDPLPRGESVSMDVLRSINIMKGESIVSMSCLTSISSCVQNVMRFMW